MVPIIITFFTHGNGKCKKPYSSDEHYQGDHYLACQCEVRGNTSRQPNCSKSRHDFKKDVHESMVFGSRQQE